MVAPKIEGRGARAVEDSATYGITPVTKPVKLKPGDIGLQCEDSSPPLPETPQPDLKSFQRYRPGQVRGCRLFRPPEDRAQRFTAEVRLALARQLSKSKQGGWAMVSVPDLQPSPTSPTKGEITFKLRRQGWQSNSDSAWREAQRFISSKEFGAAFEEEVNAIVQRLGYSADDRPVWGFRVENAIDTSGEWFVELTIVYHFKEEQGQKLSYTVPRKEGRFIARPLSPSRHDSFRGTVATMDAKDKGQFPVTFYSRREHPVTPSRLQREGRRVVAAMGGIQDDLASVGLGQASLAEQPLLYYTDDGALHIQYPLRYGEGMSLEDKIHYRHLIRSEEDHRRYASTPPTEVTDYHVLRPKKERIESQLTREIKKRLKCCNDLIRSIKVGIREEVAGPDDSQFGVIDIVVRP